MNQLLKAGDGIYLCCSTQNHKGFCIKNDIMDLLGIVSSFYN